MLYGSFIPFEDILEGKVTPKTDMEQFLAVVRKYSGQAKSEVNTSRKTTEEANR